MKQRSNNKSKGFISKNWSDILFGSMTGVMLALLYMVIAQPLSTGSISGPAKYTPENQNLMNINKLREVPLEEKKSLSRSAQLKADDLASGADWSHDSPSAKFSAIIFEHNPDAVEVGENLAKCFGSEDAALEAWKQSQSHLENIKGDWQYWGRGVATGNGCTYIVDHFSREK